MKKLSSFIKSFVVASLVFSATSGEALGRCKPKDSSAPPKPPVPVTLMSPDYSFDLNFTALYMKPFANNLDYAAEALPFNYGDSQPAISPSWVIPQIDTDLHFGFDLGVAGIFHDASSTIMLNWERFHSSNDSNTVTVSSISNMVGPFFEIGPDASAYKTATGKVKFHFDEVNLDYGTFVNFGKLLRMNLFSGVSFSRIYEHRFTTISNLTGTIVRTLDVPAKFFGAGPQLGLNFDYMIYKGLQFVGMSRATLFVGKFQNKTTFTTNSADLVTLGDQNPNIQTTKVYDKTGIVPGFEGKLGFAYEHLFSGHYMFKIEAGYQAQIYINSIRSVDMGSEVALSAIGSVGSTTTGVYARTFERVVSDFGLAGPYATVNFGF